ncbi:hypothetical protein KCU95_g2437, partial [Aureobasidium melanogenum]
MSAEYQNQVPLKLAQQAERDLNSYGAKQGQATSDSALESGVDESVTNKFPGAEVNVGSTGASNNQRIPLSEGNDIDPSTGKPFKAGAFEGVGGPEDKAHLNAQDNGGDDSIRSNIRN